MWLLDEPRAMSFPTFTLHCPKVNPENNVMANNNKILRIVFSFNFLIILTNIQKNDNHKYIMDINKTNIILIYTLK